LDKIEQPSRQDLPFPVKQLFRYSDRIGIVQIGASINSSTQLAIQANTTISPGVLRSATRRTGTVPSAQRSATPRDRWSGIQPILGNFDIAGDVKLPKIATCTHHAPRSG
jgi:hypothetical protein